MTRHNAAFADPDFRAPALADQAQSEGERIVRDFPVALAMYAGDVYSAIHSAGLSALNLNIAMLSHDLSTMQRCAELIATEANTANVLAEKIAKKVAELRRRNPESGVR